MIHLAAVLNHRIGRQILGKVKTFPSVVYSRVVSICHHLPELINSENILLIKNLHVSQRYDNRITKEYKNLPPGFPMKKPPFFGKNEYLSSLFGKN